VSTKPARACTKPGCRGLIRGEACTVCGPRPKHGWRDDRGTRQERGYDAAWMRLRQAHLMEHPLCEQCKANGRITPARHVDHIEEFCGLDDLKRLDPANLRSLCVRCHMAKTAKHAPRG
jgi:5-methylcytosine-specific restriction enzyme A